MVRKFLLVTLLVLPLSFYPFLRDTSARIDIKQTDPKPQSQPLTPDQQLVLGCFSILPGQTFPASIPWEPFRKIGQQESRALEDLAEHNPVEFLALCLSRYNKEVNGYVCIFDKQEKVNGKLRKPERIRCHFREKPFSVHMDWLKGNDIFAAVRTLYVDGENDGVLVARATLGLIVHKKLDDPKVKDTSRFPITEFGAFIGAKNTHLNMQRAQDNGTLYVTYEGIVRVKELGNRLCYKLIRSPYVPPEEDNVCELEIYVDLVTQMQVGSILRDDRGELIASYFFRDFELNPNFNEKQFTIKSL